MTDVSADILPLEIWHEISLDSIGTWYLLARTGRGFAAPIHLLIDKHCELLALQTKVINTIRSTRVAHSIMDLPAVTDVRSPRLWATHNTLGRHNKYASVDDMGMCWRIDDLLDRTRDYPRIIYHDGGMEWWGPRENTDGSLRLPQHITKDGVLIYLCI